MNPTRVLVLTLLLLVICGTRSSSAAENPEWLAGVASVKITPQKPVPLAGYAARTQPFESVDQDIDAKALVLDDQKGHRAVLVTIDLCILPQDVGQEVRRRIAETTKIDPSSILLNVAHSHSAPAVALKRDPTPGQVNPSQEGTIEYTHWLMDRLVEVSQSATSHMRPAKLSWGTGVTSFVMNRRQFTDRGVILGVNPRGLVDRSVPVLRVDGADGKPVAILFGYACHNTTMPAKRLAVSGDFEGYAKEYVQQHYPGAEAMFMIGCAGDANPYPRQEVTDATNHGEELGREVCRVLETKLQPVRGPLTCALVDAELPLQVPDRQSLETTVKSGSALNKMSAREMLVNLDAAGKLPEIYHAPVEAWQFGKDLTLIALPDEVVVQYVHRLEKAVGPLRLWISAYCQEVAGYIPSDNVLREGGYETRGLYIGTGWFAPGVEDALVKAAAQAAMNAGRTVEAAATDSLKAH